MSEQKPPRTRLEQLLRQRHLTLEEFRRIYERTGESELSQRQAYRWVAGEMTMLPATRSRGSAAVLLASTEARALGALNGRQLG